MTYHRYEFEMGMCDECKSDYDEAGRKTMEQRHPDLYKLNERGQRMGIKDEYFAEWREATDWSVLVKRPIFVFVADCGGDAIYLCQKHLQEAVDGLANFKEG